MTASERPPASSRPVIVSPLFAVTTLLSAFLLFQVELVLGKHLLPWFGGAPAVWVTCLLFFQAVLFLGYAYAHGLVRALSPRRQMIVHGALLIATVALLGAHWASWGSPLLPPASWKPAPNAPPVREILVLLGASVGLPFLALAASSPLLQAWLARSPTPGVPYRLYALSNLGSLLGLLSYPFVLEPTLTLRAQSLLWSVLFALFAGACVVVALRAAALAPASTVPAEPVESGQDSPTWGQRALWLGLAFTGSALLLAVSNQICQEITSFPLLWVLPLVVYLGTFIVAFQGERWCPRWLAHGLFLIGLALACWVLYHDIDVPVLMQVAIFSLTLLGACLACNGELYRLRPGTSHLTSYYLTIALGGALGGAFVALAAPHWFSGLWELHASLLLAAAFVVFALFADRDSWLRRGVLWPAVATLAFAVAVTVWLLGSAVRASGQSGLSGTFAGQGATLVVVGLAVVALLAFRLRNLRIQPRLIATLCLGLALAALSFTLRSHISALSSSVRLVSRGFFGVLRVQEMAADDEEEHAYWLLHGRIAHGFQYANPAYRTIPTSYYSQQSGVGLAIRNHPKRRQTPTAGLRVGALGLGVGTVAAHCLTGDEIRFYEISARIAQVAKGEGGYFTYLRDSKAKVEVVLGDARLALEGELERGTPQGFDVLVADAFSGGAVPAHLLTREAFELYLAHLAPDGILAFNVSNQSLDLAQVVWRAASELNLHGVLVDNPRSLDGIAWHSVWVLLSRERATLAAPEITAAASPAPPNAAELPLWTDQHSSVLPILRRRAWRFGGAG